MQTYDGEGLLAASMNTVDELTDELKKNQDKITHAVIGKIPSKGDIIKINGLLYKVKAVNAIEGTFRAKILKSKEECE